MEHHSVVEAKRECLIRPYREIAKLRSLGSQPQNSEVLLLQAKQNEIPLSEHSKKQIPRTIFVFSATLRRCTRQSKSGEHRHWTLLRLVLRRRRRRRDGCWCCCNFPLISRLRLSTAARPSCTPVDSGHERKRGKGASGLTPDKIVRRQTTRLISPPDIVSAPPTPSLVVCIHISDVLFRSKQAAWRSHPSASAVRSCCLPSHQFPGTAPTRRPHALLCRLSKKSHRAILIHSSNV